MFKKMLTTIQVQAQAVKVMEKIVAELLLASKKPLREFVFEHSDNLSLFLCLRHTYFRGKFQDQSSKVGKHLSTDLLQDEEELEKLKTIIGKSVYIYPRLH